MSKTQNVQRPAKSGRWSIGRSGRTGFYPFGIVGAPPLHVPPGIRYETIECLHASDLDRFMDQYRQQHIEDEERAAVSKLERERGFRKAVRDAVIARNAHLDARNVAINLRMLDAQDQMYDFTLRQRLRAIPKLAAEIVRAGRG